MTVSVALDVAGRRRSPATMPGYHAGRPPRNKGMRYPADPPTVAEIVSVMRQTADNLHGWRVRFEALGFDDSTWSTGQAAFGTAGGPCAGNNNGSVHTPWSLGTDMLVRKSFTLPSSATNVRVDGTVANDATVYVNGVQIGFVASGFCNSGDIALAATSAVAGMNLLAVRGRDDGSTASYLDQTVTYQVPLYALCLRYDPAKAHKLGSTIPLKTQLCDENANNVSSPSITVHATGLAKVDNSATATVEDSGNANPDDDFRYSADLAGYIFNKSTKGLNSGTWRMTITVDGDSEPGYVLLFDVK